MTYSIKEVFYTLQGEGHRAGRPAVFCRFAGCNLWTGREEDRSRAICRFCDTDFVGANGTLGGKFDSADSLANVIAAQWPAGEAHRYVVLTGGEPLLQVDSPLVDALHRRDFEIAVETNGTVPAPSGIDWICVSPKAGTTLAIRSGDELKLVYPQEGIDPGQFTDLAFGRFYLQPMDGPCRSSNTERAVEYCRQQPKWNLSVQTHKMIGIR
ncbi:MAG TPA: 7-carboxy-7-deazaguanine synthase [Albitalea sp.]|uniref:7-carboxy-7-deazaguanine synthase n=1 Tax=Piscinibacter sp. TaxID=1903157 RepID=UPI002ED56189